VISHKKSACSKSQKALIEIQELLDVILILSGQGILIYQLVFLDLHEPYKEGEGELALLRLSYFPGDYKS
jgi:hypothetical protein